MNDFVVFCLFSLTDLCMVSLTESGARSKIDQSCLPWSLLVQWDRMQRCSCGKLCHPSSNVRGVIKTNPSRITQTFVTDGNLLGSEAFLRCVTLFCSRKCIDLYKNQPLNFRWNRHIYNCEMNYNNYRNFIFIIDQCW